MRTLALVTLAAALVLQPVPAPAHRVVRVSDALAVNPVESSVAIDPGNRDRMIAVSYQTGLPRPPRTTGYIYVSHDGGRTWRNERAANPLGRTQGDDLVVFAAPGVALHTYISFLGIRAARPTRAENGIFVTRTDDAGLTWSHPVAAVDHANTVLPFEDKPWIAAEGDKVYAAWTRFDEYGVKDPSCRTHIVVARSEDGARSFQMPRPISDTPGDCVDSDNTVEGAVPAIGVDGRVHVAWAGPKGIVHDSSADGITWGADRVVTTTPGGWDIPIPGITRHNGMPVTAVDKSATARRGTLYINWIDERNGDPDVFVIRSNDNGATWSPPVRVNDDPLRNGAVQFFTWMAVDPSDGSVNVLFYDRRGRAGTLSGLTLARSTDGGATFRNHPVSIPDFEVTDKVTFGDYLGVDANAGRVVGVFPHIVDGKVVLSAAIFDFK
ncbi:MAG: glycoside hydrolase [Acidobacteriota bacterium]|nr:glycoside hydrolase [Acidobacteriota bacterium]